MNRKHLPKTLLLILILIYWTVSLRHLTVVPPVYEDEPWQASTAWKIANEGVFGSDIFAGYYGMESHYYGYLPVHPLLMAVIFKLAGPGLFQARFETVVLGLFILALTYRLGGRLFRPSIGLLAAFLLLFTRTTAVTPSQYSGIVLIDMARIARYDPAVPVFALAALLLFTHLNNKLPITNYALRITNFVLIGLLTALASLSHLYGLFWFPVFLLLLIWHRLKWQNIAAYVGGFLLPWSLYLAYVLPAWPDWLGQTRDYAPRFNLLDPAWYGQNVVHELQRYSPGFGAGFWFRPGFWIAAVIVPLALVALGRLALQGQKKAQILIIPAVLLPTLFALLIYLKLTNYLITLAPLFALVMAWGLVAAYDYSGRFSLLENGRVRRLIQGGIVLLLLAIAVEGSSRLVHLEQAAKETTPYAEFSAEISRQLPADGRILALHNYWFGFENRDYRSWFVPLLQSNPDYWQPPLSIEAALNGVDPTIILIDHRMRELFEADPETAEAILSWMAAEGFDLSAVVEVKTYGRMDIYIQTGENE